MQDFIIQLLRLNDNLGILFQEMVRDFGWFVVLIILGILFFAFSSLAVYGIVKLSTIVKKYEQPKQEEFRRPFGKHSF